MKSYLAKQFVISCAKKMVLQGNEGTLWELMNNKKCRFTRQATSSILEAA